MSVGSTDTWSSNRDQIIAEALAICGQIAPGRDATGRSRDDAARTLNRIVKALDAEGQFLWRISRLTITTTSGTASYSLSALATAVDDPMSYLPAAATTARKPIEPMSRDEYMMLTDRTQSGTPQRYFLERTVTGDGRLQLTAIFWPVPDTTGDTIEYAASLRAKDYETGATTSDFPTSWISCLVYGLVAELAPKYRQLPLGMTYRQLFEAEKAKMLGADNEQMGIMFVPWGG